MPRRPNPDRPAQLRAPVAADDLRHAAYAPATAAGRRALLAEVKAGCEDRPGTYRMLGATGLVLYVGKAKRLRTRLLSYFRSAQKNRRRDKQARILRHAHAIGLLTTPYCFHEREAEQMTDAGADIVVAHMGLTTKGTIGARTALSLDEAADRVRRIADAAHGVNREVLVICHGGPIAEPDDAAFVLARARGGVVGFYGASSMERLPTEQAIRDQARRFADLRLGS